MNRCKNCMHWDSSRVDSDDKQWGWCALLAPGYRGRKLATIPGPPASAGLETRADFGCVQFQGEPEEDDD